MDPPKSDEGRKLRVFPQTGGCSHKLGQSDGEIDWFSEMVGVIKGQSKNVRNKFEEQRKKKRRVLLRSNEVCQDEGEMEKGKEKKRERSKLKIWDPA